MNFMIRNVLRLLYLKFLIICFVSCHQSVSSTLNANKTVNRKNDKFYEYFSNKKFDELSTRNSELRHSVNNKFNQKLNISLVVSNRNESRNPIEPEFHNEFTEMQTPVENREKNITNDCQCKCDPYQTAEQLINEYVLNYDEDPDMDVDDHDELEQLQKPYKYIPMETIELAHQRPQRVTTTPAPIQSNAIKNIVQSMSSYLTFPKYSSTDYIQLALSLLVTGVVGILGTTLGPFNVYNSLFRSESTNRNFNSRQFNANDDMLSLIYQWIQSLDSV